MTEQKRKALSIAALIAVASCAVLFIVYLAHSRVDSFSQLRDNDYARLVAPLTDGPTDGSARKHHAAKAATEPATPAELAAARSQSLKTLKLASVPGYMGVPPLEKQRARAELDSSAAILPQMTIETGFEASPKMAVREISPTHFALEAESPFWFMFSVHGVAGKTVRFDIVNPGVGLAKWSTLNPVYTYANDLDDPATYAVDEGADAAENQRNERSWNGSPLPSTVGQKWHYISNAWEEDVHQFSFVQRFEKDDAVIAMRVPRPPGYNEHFFASLASNPHAKVIEVGRSEQDRGLLLAEIGEGGDAVDHQKPCILIYAGEHADEQDAMWVAQGAIITCLADTPVANEIRRTATILVIPCLDPDAAGQGRHSGIMLSFHMGSRTSESIQYANWFMNWVGSGKRLDIVLDLHNVQSSEGAHLYSALLEGIGRRGDYSTALHTMIVQHLQDSGFSVKPTPGIRGWSPTRLGGWLTHQYGPLTLAYELNTEAPTAHLNLSRVKFLGGRLANVAAEFLSSPPGINVRKEVDLTRSRRLERLASSSPASGDGTESDAIEEETASWEHATAAQLEEVSLERRVP